MRTKKEILAEIARLENLAQHKQPLANVLINAPLALIQVDIEARIQVFEWMLNRKKSNDA